MAEERGMIKPYVPHQVSSVEEKRIVSYGTSSYGYDIRCADEFKIFTNINSAIVDPKNFDANSFVDVKSDVCIIPPNSFALAQQLYVNRQTHKWESQLQLDDVKAAAGKSASADIEDVEFKEAAAKSPAAPAKSTQAKRKRRRKR